MKPTHNNVKRMAQALPTTWVWRKRGSGSPESLCEFASFAPVRTSPMPRLRQALAR